MKQRAYQHIRSRLLEGSLEPGMRVSLTAMAKEIGTSHIPVREAVSQLRSERLVDHAPGRGFFVREPSRKELAGLFQLREVLEGLAASEAVKRMSHAEIERLAQLFDEMVGVLRDIRDEGIIEWKGPLVLRQSMLDLAFHTILVRAADNEVLTRAVMEHQVLSQVFGRPIGEQDTDMVKRLAMICRGHYRVLKALRRRDPEAAGQAMKKHVREVSQYLLNAYDLWAQSQAKPERIPTTALDMVIQMEKEYFQPPIGGQLEGTHYSSSRKRSKRSVNKRPQSPDSDRNKT
ncbi:MAG: GntR family transcriptional regulator [Pirellulales bacterium]|nr:GntR family transcriptional regulator [Pirellulales bacterium]